MGYTNSLPDSGGSSKGLAGPPGPQGPKGAQGPKGDPGTGFKLASDGNFDIERKRLLNLEVLPDAKIDDSLAITRKDFYSGVNKGYVNDNFLKKTPLGTISICKVTTLKAASRSMTAFMKIEILFQNNMLTFKTTNRISQSTISFQKTGQVRWRVLST